MVAEQRQRAKSDARAKKSGVGSSAAYRELREPGPTTFTRYVTLESETVIRAVMRHGEMVTGASPGEIVEVVLEVTPFYAESGGQIADEGTITVRGSARGGGSADMAQGRR